MRQGQGSERRNVRHVGDVDDGSTKTIFGERGKKVGLQPTAQLGFTLFDL